VASCSGGTCGAICGLGWANCNGQLPDGCEVQVAIDVNNCGSCGTTCAISHATAGCASGACTVAACDANYADCDGIAWNGCEVHVTVDGMNCGTCGHVCPTPTHASFPSCSLGSCGIGACSAGYADCNNNPADGCETSITTDTNCGGCGNVCAPGKSCVSGSCI
jgi:hypothetical protein